MIGVLSTAGAALAAVGFEAGVRLATEQINSGELTLAGTIIGAIGPIGVAFVYTSRRASAGTPPPGAGRLPPRHRAGHPASPRPPLVVSGVEVPDDPDELAALLAAILTRLGHVET